MGTAGAELRCVVCGERVARTRARETFAHVSRVVAACDLDSDHAAAPDWRALGEVPCRRCGAPAVADGTGVFTHVDSTRETDHAADPGHPGR